jgi:hypothetical protein
MNPSSTFAFDYAGLHGRPARCGLEIHPLDDGRTAVIATELSDNPGVSVTNFAEELAMLVCKGWRIDPAKLVWIEHYPADPCPACAGTARRNDSVCRACGGCGTRREAATYDLVTFTLDASTGELSDPKWRPMREEGWRELGIEARQ